MKLLVTTQAVDLNDPVLGFFHRWIEELAKKCEQVHVICLKEGTYRLPKNVSVHSLGKPSFAKASKGAGGRVRSRLQYVLRFYHLIYRLRHEYDTVFVHMNSEYVVLGGFFWRLWGKRIVLWRNHKMAGLTTWLAAHLAHAVCYTSPSAYVAKFKSARLMPIGIDTGTFARGGSKAPVNSVLFFGRLDEVKHPDVFVQALEQLFEKGVSFTADIVGDPTDPVSQYAHAVRNRATTLGLEGVLTIKPAVVSSEAPELFRTHAIYVNLTPSGSFDKTIGEAAACGNIVVAANEVLRGVVPDEVLVDPLSAEKVAQGIEYALNMSESERSVLSKTLREYIERNHSLALLVQRLMPLFEP